MQRPYDRSFALWFHRLPADLADIIERNRPTSASLAKLEEPLSAADIDDGVGRELLRMRAAVVDQSPAVRPQYHWEDIAARPFSSHYLVRQLGVYSALLAATQTPWP